MPKVFITKMAINQFLWSVFAAVHKASPFQNNDHNIIRKKTKGDA